MLVFLTYGWDILAGAVDQGSQTVHRNHISCYASVGLEATVVSKLETQVSIHGPAIAGLPFISKVNYKISQCYCN